MNTFQKKSHFSHILSVCKPMKVFALFHMHVSASSRENVETWLILGSSWLILSRPRKNGEGMLAFRELLEAHFGAPKNCKS